MRANLEVLWVLSVPSLFDRTEAATATRKDPPLSGEPLPADLPIPVGVAARRQGHHRHHIEFCSAKTLIIVFWELNRRSHPVHVVPSPGCNAMRRRGPGE